MCKYEYVNLPHFLEEVPPYVEVTLENQVLPNVVELSVQNLKIESFCMQCKKERPFEILSLPNDLDYKKLIAYLMSATPPPAAVRKYDSKFVLFWKLEFRMLLLQ